MIDAYVKMLKNYATFTGRSRRSDYWYAFLANFIIGLILGVLKAIVPALLFLSVIYSLAVLIPGIALTVRRLHDTGKSGFWIFIAFVPLVGGIILIVFLATDSEPDNMYGPNPKAYQPTATYQ